MALLNHNKTLKSVDWGYNTEGFEFKKCSEVPLDTPIRIHGVFVTPDNGYGEGAVAIMDKALLNMPSRYVQLVKDILADAESIDDLKTGNFGIKVTTFVSKQYKKTGYDIELVVM